MSEPSQHPQVWPSAQPQSQRQPQPWPPVSPQSGNPMPPGYPVAGAAAPLGLDQKTAERSRKMRTWIGVIALVVGALDLIGTVLIAVLMATHPGDPAFADFNGAMVVLGTAEGIAYVGFGIWALVTRRTTKRGPIVAVLVLASLGLVLGLFDVVEVISSGRTPQLGSYVLLAFLVQRTIAVLRLAPARNPYAAIRTR